VALAGGFRPGLNIPDFSVFPCPFLDTIAMVSQIYDAGLIAGIGIVRSSWPPA
jgi:hypothetical protein